MVRLLDWGVAPPYREPPVTGLKVRAMDGASLYDATRSQRWFVGFEDVPQVLVQTLLYIENRELLSPYDPRANPAIEWDRMAKASLLYTGTKLGLPVPLQGGSTLAIQLEKYRHSPNGRTELAARQAAPGRRREPEGVPRRRRHARVAARDRRRLPEHRAARRRARLR